MTVDRLHPEIAEAAQLIHIPVVDDDLVATARSVDFPTPPLSDDVVRTDLVVPGVDGDPDVPVRVHRAAGAGATVEAGQPLPCVYSIHGGGYVLGSYAMDDAWFDDVCPRLGVAGVSVEYRLAPDTPYPGPLEDCYRGLVWTYEHADDLGIDRDRIGVHGVSAGGGLAAALALLARDRGEVPIAFQVLDSPMLDDRQITPSSRLDDLVVWSRESNAFGWRSYLGDLHGGDDVPYTAAPGRAAVDDLAGLPPAFVSVGAVDGFVDEDVDYALRLNRAGVPTELHVYPGACHGYQIAVDSDTARQSARDKEAFIARHT